MEDQRQNMPTEETIDKYDDEYGEDENYQSNTIQAPIEVPQPKVNLLQEKDEIQINPEEDENTDEENIINDPKVKELNELDINNKKAIIDILMDEDLIEKKPIKNSEYVDLIEKKPIKNSEYVKDINKIKFSYVKSNINFHTMNTTYEQEKKNTLGRTGLFQIETQVGDPEFIKDMNIAADKLKDQIKEENKVVAHLLFDDLKNKKNNKKKILTRKHIGEKVKKALNKKKEDIQKIENKIFNKQKSLETFTPEINHRKKDGSRRDLNTFLKSQEDFRKKVEKKKQEMFLKNESEIKEIVKGKPQLDKNSEELIKKIYGTENTEPAYLRLYNKMVKNEEKLKQCEEKKILREKEEEQKRKEKENEIKKNNPYKHIKSKFNSQKNFDVKKNLNNKLKRVKSAENIKSSNNLNYDSNINKKVNFDYKVIQLNKVLYNKFLSNFDNAIKLISEETKKNNLEELDEYQYFKLLLYLGMISNPMEKTGKNEKNLENLYNLLHIREKQLVKSSYNLLKISGEKIKKEDVKNFLICVLGLQNYNLYQMFRSAHEQEIKNLFPPYEYKKEEIPELILNKQNEELISKVNKKNKKNNKYILLSKDNKIIFTLDKAYLINRDFNKFAVNFRSQKNKIKEEKLLNLVKKECTFKPEIGMKSNELYQKHKDKVNAMQNETFFYELNPKMKKTNLNYFDRILLLDRKRLIQNQKIREEMEQKKILECTFQPKISNYLTNNINNKNNKHKKLKNKNSYGSSKISNKINKNKLNGLKKNVFDELYEDGKQKLKSRKDKTKEEIELEEQKLEFTFKPNIKNLDPKKIPKTNFINDIYNETEYQTLYERLKHARLQRLVKNNTQNRYGLNKELKQFVMDNKKYNYLQNNQYYETDDPFYYNTLEIMSDLKNSENVRTEVNEKNNCDRMNKSQEIKYEKNRINERHSIDNNNNYEEMNLNNNVIIEEKNEEKIDEKNDEINGSEEKRDNYNNKEEKLIRLNKNVELNYKIEKNKEEKNIGINKNVEKKDKINNNNNINNNRENIIEINKREEKIEDKDNKIGKNVELNKKLEKNTEPNKKTEKINELNKKIEKNNENELNKIIEKNNQMDKKKEKNIELNKKIENNNELNKKIKKNIQLDKKIEKSDEINKKEEIPLLIIDVNIGQGIKKKIYVYEGDTAENLAENFASEYNLEPDIKNRLESLIHNHMQRLLRIDEEENLPSTRKYKNVYRIKSS